MVNPQSHHTPQIRISAFTLIELLVVVAIIVALLAILLPSMGRAVDLAIRTQCTSNTKQQGTAFMTYAADYQAYYPTADNKDKGGTQWRLNALYVMNQSQGIALRDRGLATDKVTNTHDADPAADVVPGGTAWKCPARTGYPRGFGTWGLLHIDHYVVLTDLGASPYNFTGNRSPVRVGEPGALTACQTYVDPTGGSWTGAHSGGDGSPEGFTQVQSDLSARWVHVSTLPLNGSDVPIPLYDSGWPWKWTWAE